jgi:hypothetical protein
MMETKLRFSLLFGTLALIGSAATNAAPVTFSAAGVNAASIQGTVDAFRTSLGTLNANVGGSFGSGRREINWDGVPDAFAAPNSFPANFFNSNSPRGVTFATPGTGFQVSATAASGTAIEFGNINATYSGLFTTFSAQRLFTALGSTITDVSFFVPGTNTPGFTTAFGAVFTDVDLASISSLQFFDLNNNSLGTFFVPSFTGNETLSFLGVQFNAGEAVGRVRITSGNQVLGAGNTTEDLVVMDDFIFAEPRAVPEPATSLLMLVPLVALIAIRSRRSQRGLNAAHRAGAH